MGNKCKICGKSSSEADDFCELHGRAYANVVNAFEKWSVAYSDRISMQGYLRMVRDRPETGEAAREVIDQMLRPE